jgi:hypothetical protein
VAKCWSARSASAYTSCFVGFLGVELLSLLVALVKLNFRFTEFSEVRAYNLSSDVGYAGADKPRR